MSASAVGSSSPGSTSEVRKRRRGRRDPAVTEAWGVVHDVPLHGFVIGGYTREGDAEPGSRCKSDTVLATVTRELGPHVATGPTGLGRQGESARPGSQETTCIL